MDIEHQLKVLLAKELCAILDGWAQVGAAAGADTHQSEISRLRRGDLRRFSVGRLLRMISRSHYNIDVRLKAMPRVYGEPRVRPSATVVRYDRWGHACSSS